VLTKLSVEETHTCMVGATALPRPRGYADGEATVVPRLLVLTQITWTVSLKLTGIDTIAYNPYEESFVPF
jgi:hypothetical protein